ncbi:unnamed protein product [Mytilus coruscus]|uniref:Uncharacterized protein n=1 Tax=Mytilus coruscus TaxID=42192 RepID=A0A6J8EU26_MYTCO|nr:unnamed protein product [Mytilus coruscus]
MCDLKDFANDFNFLMELKSYLKEYVETNVSKNVEDGISKGIYSKLVDGRGIRLVLPHGCDVLRSVSLENYINFVGFIGFNKPSEQVSETLRDKVWDIDGKLVEEFSNHEDIIAYVSAERSIGGEWGNLVLLKSFDAIEKWRDCPVHHTAVSFIGFYKPPEQLTQTLKDEVCNIDGKLIEEFSNHVDILAYVTAERALGGDSGNLVLLKSLEAIKEWTNRSVHHIAIREISPYYYSKVRIHRGRFVNGKTCTYQTLFIDYIS